MGEKLLVADKKYLTMTEDCSIVVVADEIDEAALEMIDVVIIIGK